MLKQVGLSLFLSDDCVPDLALVLDFLQLETRRHIYEAVPLNLLGYFEWVVGTFLERVDGFNYSPHE